MSCAYTAGRWADEGKFGVGILQFTVVGVHLVDEERNGVAVAVAFVRKACFVNMCPLGIMKTNLVYKRLA